jgi:hypothetical protein
MISTMASGQQRAADARRDRKLKEYVERVVDAWAPPPASECEESTIPTAVDPDNLITMRRVEYRGQLVDYAIIWTTRDGSGVWRERVCIDCKHGTVHRHDGPHDASEPKFIRAILSQQDVQESFKSSFDEVYDAYLESVQ